MKVLRNVMQSFEKSVIVMEDVFRLLRRCGSCQCQVMGGVTVRNSQS